MTIITLTASIPTSVAAGMLVNWLWEKLKGRKAKTGHFTKIAIDRTEVEFDEGEIKRIVYEKITKNADDKQEEVNP